VELYKELAARNPEAFQPDLVRSLNNLSNRLSELGRHEEALAAKSEAEQLWSKARSASNSADKAVAPGTRSWLEAMSIGKRQPGQHWGDPPR
jgi:hypothetical protein